MYIYPRTTDQTTMKQARASWTGAHASICYMLEYKAWKCDSCHIKSAESGPKISPTASIPKQ